MPGPIDSLRFVHEAILNEAPALEAAKGWIAAGVDAERVAAIKVQVPALA